MLCDAKDTLLAHGLRSAHQTSAAAITAGGVAGWRSLIGAMDFQGHSALRITGGTGLSVGSLPQLSGVAEHLHRLVSGRSASDQP